VGTVLDFDTPPHTAYPCRGVVGIDGFILVGLYLLFLFQNKFFSFFLIFFRSVIPAHGDRTQYGYAIEPSDILAFTTTTTQCTVSETTKLTIHLLL
jgi:hypothetical protein